jgi:lipoprotein-anchoring transpeptidase ErfK/SrfK
MDGDGASGDLPYSIEDVPFVAYFKGSYALHAAFWHSNFGREMSHGCVNLAPRDAKVVFDFVDPQVPKGWHGVFATKDRRGSLVVLHE